MSALARMIETRGVATTVIGLVRPHLESTKSPRSLWVPFPLGRPLGEPENVAFQRRVLMAALGLLERQGPEPILDDFPSDAPSMTDTAGWQSAIVLPKRGATLPQSAAEWTTALLAEFQAVAPHAEAAQKRFGRTMVGNSRLPREEWVPFAVQFLEGDVPESPVEGLSPALVVRLIADDIKSFYSEAVQAEGDQPSPGQINTWFWGQTLAAEFLRALRSAALETEHNGFRTAGSRFIVPMPYVSAP